VKIMATVLDIEKLPEYWDQVAVDKDAEALRLKNEADDARATAYKLRAERGEVRPASTPELSANYGEGQRMFPPSQPINRREAAHQRLVGLPPYEAAEPSNEQIEAQARKNFTTLWGGAISSPLDNPAEEFPGFLDSLPRGSTVRLF
jgi:hypothetical protein